MLATGQVSVTRAVGYVVVFLAARSMRDRRADPAPLGTTREAAR